MKTRPFENHLLKLFLLICTATNSFSQDQVQISSKEIGLDHLTNTPIQATEYRFASQVYTYFPDFPNNTFTVQQRVRKPNKQFWTNSGEIIVFDPLTGQKKWSRKMKYHKSAIRQGRNVMLEQSINKLAKINPENGMTIWKSKSTIYGIYPEYNLALGYNYKSAGPPVLHGIDLTTGNSLWNRPVTSEFGWENTNMLNDSLLLVTSAGLHAINLNNGRGWDINRISHASKTDFKKVGLTLLAGLALATAGGGVLIPGNMSDMFLNISSNVLRDGDNLYFAAKNKISGQNLNGDRLWDTDLNEKLTSKSHLFREGNTLYMLNTGYATKYYRPSSFGTPFLAAFDIESGKQLFIKVWEERKDFIVDYMIQENEIFLLYKNKIEIFQFSENGASLSNRFDIENKSDLFQFVSDQIFVKADSSYLRLSLDTSHYHVITNDVEILQLDNDFNTAGKVSKENIYRVYLETKDYIFLGNKEQTIVLDKINGKPVATLQIPLGSARFGNRLYHHDDKSISEVDISRFVEIQ